MVGEPEELTLRFRYTVIEALAVAFHQRRRYLWEYRNSVRSAEGWRRLVVGLNKYYLDKDEYRGKTITEKDRDIMRGRAFLYRLAIVYYVPKWGVQFVTGLARFYLSWRKERVCRLRLRELEISGYVDLPLVELYGKRSQYFAKITQVRDTSRFIAISFLKRLPPNWDVGDLEGKSFIPKRLFDAEALARFRALAEVHPLARLG